MTRMSKQGKVRAISPRRPRPPAKKTGPKKDALAFRLHHNAIESENVHRYIPKITR